MKKFFTVFSREVIALYVVTQIAQGIVFANFIEGLVITGVALALARYLVKPIINILLLPINLATLGLFKFVSHAVTIWVVDVAISDFAVVGFNFAGFSSRFIDIPAVNFDSLPLAYVGFSFLLSLVVAILE